MTAFLAASHIIGGLSLLMAWFRGGRPERFGAGVLLLNQMTVSYYDGWLVGAFEPGTAADDIILMLVFGMMALTSRRWWPLVVTATLALCVVVHGLALVTSMTHYASVSARIGLWTVIQLALAAGVLERWLAGERPAADSAVWSRRRRTLTS
ncbi:MAG: hypothetical protein KL785_03215 [Brevundimonas sp.]|nr:hypothetical protein [Brevundimonas sp.]